MKAWPFDQSPNTVTLTTRFVLEGKEEIRVAVHQSDDHSWQFLCGTTERAEDARVIAMHEALAMDSSLSTIADLLPGWSAWRESKGAEWHRERDESDG